MKADPKKVKRQLAIAKGQIEGIQKMVDENAYCIDISNQLMAAIAVLKKADEIVLLAHIKHCVHDASCENELDEKLSEVGALLHRMGE